jgi:hypothetical protein
MLQHVLQEVIRPLAGELWPSLFINKADTSGRIVLVIAEEDFLCMTRT